MLSEEGEANEEKISKLYLKLHRYKSVAKLSEQNFEQLGLNKAKIYSQPRKIKNESLNFVDDGNIDYEKIEVDAPGQVIEGLTKENGDLFGFPKGSV